MEFKITDLKVCDGPVIQTDDMIEFYYKILTTDGKVLESTYFPDIPVVLKFSPLCLLAGVYQGMIGMRTGGSLRRIEIPSRLAFGDRAWQNVAPASDLIVEIALARILHNSDAGS